MGNINDIATALKTTTGTYLGSDYAELPFAYRIENNSKIVAKGYTVIPKEASEEVTTNRAILVNQKFQIIINDCFLSSNASDSNKRAGIIALCDKLVGLYVEVAKNKGGLPGIIVIVSDMSIDDPEILEDNDFVCLRLNFSIKHRYNF
jgi:hypothetical protein